MGKTNGEGTVYRRKDGRWCGQVTLGRDPKTGKAMRKTIYGKTKREVRQKMLSIMQNLNAGTHIEAKEITLNEWMNKWLVTYKKPKIRPRTYQSYESIIRVHINEIGYYKLKDIKPIYLQEFINKKASEGLSKRTINYIKVILKAGLEQAVINSLVSSNPASHLETPTGVRPPKEERALTLEEQNLLEQSIDGAYFECAFIIALETGLRRGEILGLKWSEMDFNSKFIYVNRGLVDIKVNGKAVIVEQPPKTTAGKRGVPMSNRCELALKKHRQVQRLRRLKTKLTFTDNDLVFATRTGTYVSPNNLSKSFNRIKNKVGLTNCSFKTLRHTFATRLAENDVHLKTAQVLMGHADIKTTANIYTHVMEDVKTEAIRRLENGRNRKLQ